MLVKHTGNGPKVTRLGDVMYGECFRFFNGVCTYMKVDYYEAGHLRDTYYYVGIESGRLYRKANGTNPGVQPVHAEVGISEV